MLVGWKTCSDGSGAALPMTVSFPRVVAEHFYSPKAGRKLIKLISLNPPGSGRADFPICSGFSHTQIRVIVREFVAAALVSGAKGKSEGRHARSWTTRPLRLLRQGFQGRRTTQGAGLNLGCFPERVAAAV